MAQEKLRGHDKEVRKQELILEIARTRQKLDNLIKELSEIAPFTAADYELGAR